MRVRTTWALCWLLVLGCGPSALESARPLPAGLGLHGLVIAGPPGAEVEIGSAPGVGRPSACEVGACQRAWSWSEGAVRQWWQQELGGFRHGFTVNAGAGRLRLAVPIRGAELRLHDDGLGATLLTPSGEVHYEGLAAWDREDRPLPCHMEMGSGGLELVVDTDGATFPVTVDPFVDTTSWSVVGSQGFAQLGEVAAGLGDVNGDGYGDLALSAPGWDGPLSDAGAISVYHGGPAGPSSSPSWMRTGDQVSQRLGKAVAGAGDVDGDGYDDLLSGEPFWDGTLGDEGRARLFLGGPGGLSTSPAWTAVGAQLDVRLGTAVSSGGDVNNDGFADVLVGVPFWDGSAADEGKVSLYLGSSAGLLPSPSWTVQGGLANAGLGGAVAGVGDINGDGRDDALLGAPTWNNGVIDQGAVFVYLGAGSALATTPSLGLAGGQVGARVGSAVAAPGDVNGDGYADLAWGTGLWDTATRTDEGGVWVFAGNSSGVPTQLFTWSCGQAGAHGGERIAGPGDVNGDGFADLLVGGSQYDDSPLTTNGHAWLFAGSGPGLSSAAIWEASGDSSQAEFGLGLASGVDSNGDGFGDLLVAAWLEDGIGQNLGAAWFYPGGATAPAEIGQVLEGGSAGEHLGAALAYAGDVNGDGFDDQLVGAPGWDGVVADGGRVGLRLGGPSGPGAVAWFDQGPRSGDLLGERLAGGADLDGDGYDDVAVGSRWADNGQADEGITSVFRGSASGLVGAASWRTEGEQIGAGHGSALAMGDCNGDGFADLLVGAESWDGADPELGAVWLHLGGASGLSTSAWWAQEGPTTGERFGASATILDADADGYGEIVVGAPLAAAPTAQAGAVHVIPCGPAGPANPGVRIEGAQIGARMGTGLANAGDIDGDGYEDLLVSAPAWDGLFEDEGGAWIYLGSASGTESLPAWGSLGDGEAMAWGTAIAAAGDTDGDGLGDVLVGSGLLGVGLVGLYTGDEGGFVVPAWFGGGPQGNSGFGDALTGGDWNGDGFSDMVIGSALHDGVGLDAGRVLTHRGNGAAATSRTAPMAARLLDSGAPRAPGNRLTGTAWTTRIQARSTLGRRDVFVQTETQPVGTDFDGTSLSSSLVTDSGLLGATIDTETTGVPTDGATHSRARLRFAGNSPFGLRWGPWVALGRPGRDTAIHLRGPCGSDQDGDSACDLDDPDLDGDGFLIGPDCDDLDAAIRPGGAESCDGVDGDCDGDLADEFANLDGDGVPDCVDDDDDGDGSLDGLDCAPLNPWVAPGAPEACDLLDSDCDNDLVDGFLDSDLDSGPDCVDPDDDDDGATDGSDCALLDPAIFPGAVELCDTIDTDCDGDIVDEFADSENDALPDCIDDDDDDDGVIDTLDCAPLDAAIFPGAIEDCDTIDSDCDGNAVDEFLDTDGEGQPDCVDVDDDGDGSLDGLDCAPLDATIRPGATELCDGLDQDCDGQIDEAIPDTDSDGTADCVDDDDDGDGTDDVADCGPLDVLVWPGAPELCDAIDQDCDADVVEAFADEDGDLIPSCVDPDDDGDGTLDDGDCAPTDPTMHPQAPEDCDGLDDDCDGFTDEGFANTDGESDGADCVDPDDDEDNSPDGEDCAPADSTVHPGAVELCDSVDQDCDGDLLDGGPDVDGDGDPDCGDEDDDGTPDAEDCAPVDPAIHPGAPELCNGVDDDCDGEVESTQELEFFNFFVDLDGDGRGDPLEPLLSNPDCVAPDGYVADPSDCDDGDPAIPQEGPESGAADCKDGADQDCDGQVDIEDDDCIGALDLEPPLGCGAACDGVGATGRAGTGLLVLMLWGVRRARRLQSGALAGILLLFGTGSALAQDNRGAVVVTPRLAEAKKVLQKGKIWDASLDLRELPTSVDVVGAWVLGGTVLGLCTVPGMRTQELIAAISTARARVDALETQGASDILAQVRSRVGCLAEPAPGESLWAMHFLEAVSRSYEFGAPAAVPALERALAMRPGAGFDPSYPPEIGRFYAMAQERVLKAGRGLVFSATAGPGMVGAAWVDGLLVPAGGLPVAAGEHLVQIRGGDGVLRGGTLALKDGDMVTISDPARLADALGALERARQKQIARWLARAVGVTEDRRIWLIDRASVVVRLAEPTHLGRPRVKAPPFSVALAGGYQYAGAWHWGVGAVDLSLGLIGPLRLTVLARPAVGATWTNPVDGAAQTPIAVPWGAGLELRGPWKVAPFAVVAFSGAFDREGVEAKRLLGSRAPDPTIRLLPGVIAGGGLLAGPVAGPARFTVRVEGGVLGTDPVVRGLLGVTLGR